jgi:hypothetical protein
MPSQKFNELGTDQGTPYLVKTNNGIPGGEFLAQLGVF